jgi:Alpha/beta hydrolase domain
MNRVGLRRTARGIAATAVVLLVFAVGASAASAGVTPAGTPPPPGEAALQGVLDLGALGYEASEFYVDGDAHSYNNVSPLTADGAWSVEADLTTAPFKTRIQVLKPADPSRFNGTVYVEWMNVSAGFDATPDWGYAHVEIARQGAAYVGVSAQAVGLNQAVSAHPDRYGPAGANLVHPGDSYSYDMYSQVGQALRGEAGTIFGAAYPVQRLIAAGESQSAGRMVTYVDAFGALGVYDGYMIHSRGANGAPLRQSPLGQINVPANTLIRTDLAQPVFTFQSETDSRLPRQADTPRVRWWEIPGTAHIDTYLLKQIGASDYGTDSSAAEALFDTMVHPFSGPFPIVGSCTLGVNAGPQHWVLQAAYNHLNTWVTNGTPPPIGPRMTTSDGTGAGALVLDANGNATGGIRTPHLDVPIATLRGTGNTSAGGPLNFCALFGTTTPFSAEKLAQLYKNHGAFVSQWVRSVNAAVSAGFMLPADAEFVKDSAATSGIGKK